MKIFNPATDEELDQISITTIQELDSILERAKTSAKIYNFSNFFHRQKLMKQLQKGQRILLGEYQLKEKNLIGAVKNYMRNLGINLFTTKC